jgi:hypothetical protein
VSHIGAAQGRYYSDACQGGRLREIAELLNMTVNIRYLAISTWPLRVWPPMDAPKKLAHPSKKMFWERFLGTFVLVETLKM